MKQYVKLFEAFIKDELDAYYDFDDYIRDETFKIVFDVVDRKLKRQPWKHIPFPRLKKIWNDFAKTNIVRDENGMDIIVDILLTNIARLYINTVLSGHTREDPNQFINQYIGYVFKGEHKQNSDDKELSMTEEEFDNATDEYFYDEHWKNWRISDYAMDPLINIAIEILREDDYKAKLVLVDRALNVLHQRGDIASLFVRGGTSALDELSGKSDPQEPDYSKYGEATDKLKNIKDDGR